MKRLSLTIIAVAASSALSIAPVAAMGVSDAYDNMQVGVTYTVYEPSFTAGLKARHVGGNDLCPKGTDQNLIAQYGKGNTRNFTIFEGNPMCFDMGVGETVLTTKVNGVKAVVQAYCDPAVQTKCTKADVIRFGGHIDLTLPATAGLRPTRILIETYGGKNLSAQQLVQIAKGLKPASS